MGDSGAGPKGPAITAWDSGGRGHREHVCVYGGKKGSVAEE